MWKYIPCEKSTRKCGLGLLNQAASNAVRINLENFWIRSSLVASNTGCTEIGWLKFMVSPSLIQRGDRCPKELSPKLQCSLQLSGFPRPIALEESQIGGG
uniref:Uncharacterized protein n=1 Tax=Micrurus spixii TaxID=129469 RepID=A0A2D4NCB9_9SAUR